jgi:hypothetical protein
VAHIQVHAWDFDPTPPTFIGQPQGDEGWISCDGDCTNYLPAARTPIAWVQFYPGPNPPSNVATVTFNWGGSANFRTGIMGLVDGGAPGNGLTGAIDSSTGEPSTTDEISFGSPSGRPSFVGYVLEGQVTVARR